MKKFVSSVIFSLILSFFSVAVIVLFLSPLVSLVYYGFFAGENPITFYSHIINKVVNTEVVTIVLMAVQLFLTFGFIFALFTFVKKIINVFLKDCNA